MTSPIPDRPEGVHPSTVPPSARQHRALVLELRAEAALESDGSRKASLLYEAGCLTETALRRPAQAVQDYLAAYNADSRSRVPLYALLRMFERRGSHKNLARLYEAQLRAARTPEEKARALIDQASFDASYGGNQEALRARLLRALDDDVAGEAALLLEWQRRAVGDENGAHVAVMARGQRCDDPGQRAELLLEDALQKERDGNISAALSILKQAAFEPPRHETALVALAGFAAKHGFHTELVEAYERRAELVMAQLDAHLQHDAPDQERVAPLRSRAVALWYEAARRRCTQQGDPAGAVTCISRALTLQPDDLLLRMTRMLAYDLLEDRARSARDAEALIAAGAEGDQAAALLFRMAEHALVAGESTRARELLMDAIAQAGGSIAADAMLDDLLLDEARHQERIERRESRAASANGPRAAKWLLDAAQIANQMGDGERALALFQQAEARHPRQVETAREAYAAALGSRQPALTQFAIERMLELPLEDDERAAIVHHGLDAREDDEAARKWLEAELSPEPQREFLTKMARLRAAEAHDYSLLCRAHATLAEATSSHDAAVSHLVAAARASLRAGDLSQARALLERVLGRARSHRYAIALLKEILYRQGESEQLLSLLHQAAEADHSSRHAEGTLLAAGFAAEQEGDLSRAQQCYEEASRHSPDSPSPHWALLAVARRRGEPAVAHQALGQLCALSTGGADPVELLLVHEQRLRATPRDGNGASGRLGALLSDAAIAPHAALVLATAASDDETYALALHKLEALGIPDEQRELRRLRLIESLARQQGGALPREAPELLDPQSDDGFTAWARLAVTSAAEPAQHLDALKRLAAIARDPAVAGAARVEAAWAKRVRGDDAFDEDLDRLAFDPLTAHAVLELAHPARHAPSRARALSVLTASASAPEKRRKLLALARARLAQRDGRGARNCLNRLLDEDPHDVSALELLRVAGRMTEDYDAVSRAAEALAERVSGDLSLSLLEESAAVRMEALGDLGGAEALLRRILRESPARASAYGRLHDVLRERGDTEGLIQLASARTALVDDAEELTALFYEIARLHRACGDLDQALDALTNVLMLEEHIGAMALRVEIHTSREDWEQAVEALEALATATTVPKAQKRIARLGAADFLENRLKDPKRALGQLEALVREGHADAALHRRIADVAQRAQRYERAVQALLAAAELSPAEAAVPLRMRAGALLAGPLDQKREGARVYLDVVNAHPEHGEAALALWDLTRDPAALNGFDGYIRGRIRTTPCDAEALRDLLHIARVRGDRDAQFLGLTALLAIGAASGEERAFAEQMLRHHVAPRFEGGSALTDEDIHALAPARLDAGYAALLGSVLRSAADIDQLEPSRFGVGRSQRVGARDPSPLRDEVSSLMRALGLTLRELYLGGDDPERVAAIPHDGEVSLVIGAQVAAPLSAMHRDRLAIQLAACRMHTLPLLSRSLEQSTRLLLAAMVAGDCALPPVYAGELLGELPRSVGRALPRRTRKLLSSLTRALPDDGSRLTQQCQLSLQHTRRVALLVSANLQSALDNLLGALPSCETIERSAEARDLIGTWTSAAMSQLRQKLGLTQ